MTEINHNWLWPNPHLKDIVVKGEHTDKLGHTNNVRYLEWLEAGAWDHIARLGCSWEVKEKLGKAMVIVRTEIDYLSASYEGDHLLLGTWITDSDLKLKSSRHFQIIRLSDSSTVLKAKMDFVCISLKSGRPTKMPEIFIAAHEEGLLQSGINK